MFMHYVVFGEKSEMTARIRRVISEKISQIVKIQDVANLLEVPAHKSASSTVFIPEFHIPVNKITAEKILKDILQVKFDSSLIETVSVLPAVGKIPPRVAFKLNAKAFLDDVLTPTTSSSFSSENNSKSIVVEFSSPNIAKPFHVGHLRSTIIGNFIGNVNQHCGNLVTKLNYLGDWGTQFGLLQVGVEMNGLTDEQMQRNPIENLYHAYVTANDAMKCDDSVIVKARKYFTNLENGESPDVEKQWKKYRQYTVAELERVYRRIGVRFDQYDWESQYSQKHIADIVEQLQHKSLLFNEVDGRKVVQVDGRRVPAIKSDGSTLYLVRDIAALVDRFHRYAFDKIFYVVDNGQTDHFNACFKTTAALSADIGEDRLNHVKFGRIRGMSTRTGNVVFLRDVLDEARDIMHQKQLQSPTTKVNMSLPEVSALNSSTSNVSDVLGVSAVIINDLKQRRQRDYHFDWNRALQANGDTGVKLQYTHCRLSNLLEKVSSVGTTAVTPNLSLLAEPDAHELLMVIARFHQAVWQSSEQLEACILVNYLFSLCNSASRALKRLNVKNERSLEIQQNRILLFSSAKDTLKIGMDILGLQALTKM